MAMEARKVETKVKADEVAGMVVDHAEGDMEVEVPDVNTVEADEVVEDVQAEAVEVSDTDQADRTHTILVDEVNRCSGVQEDRRSGLKDECGRHPRAKT
jgi:hypothetical protein